MVISQGDSGTEKLLPGSVAGGQERIQVSGDVLLRGEHPAECPDHVDGQQTHLPSHHHHPAANRAPHRHTLILDCFPSPRYQSSTHLISNQQFFERNVTNYLAGLYCLIAYLQFKLFLLYNYHGHPWSRLLTEESKDDDTIKTETLPTKPVIPHII